MKGRVRLPESELEIMLIIWELSNDGDLVNTTQIMHEINSNKSVQLVQSYLKRLEEKKFLAVERLGRLNFYKPLVTLEEYRCQETTSFINSFYQKSCTKLFTSLIVNKHITEEELDEIHKLIEGDK